MEPIEKVSLTYRLALDGKLRNFISLGDETTYITPHRHGLDFDLNGKEYMIPWHGVHLVEYT